MHAYCGHELALRIALTPSPSPIGWERVAARPGEGWVHGERDDSCASQSVVGGSRRTSRFNFLPLIFLPVLPIFLPPRLPFLAVRSGLALISTSFEDTLYW